MGRPRKGERCGFIAPPGHKHEGRVCQLLAGHPTSHKFICKVGCDRPVGTNGRCQEHALESALAWVARQRAKAGYTGENRLPANSFYVCADDDLAVTKFGISNNSKRRLKEHASGKIKGRPFELTHVLAVREALPEGLPKDWEDAVKEMLRKAGAEPVAGDEYFDQKWQDFIIEVVREIAARTNTSHLWIAGFELTDGSLQRRHDHDGRAVTWT